MTALARAPADPGYERLKRRLEGALSMGEWVPAADLARSLGLKERETRELVARVDSDQTCDLTICADHRGYRLGSIEDYEASHAHFVAAIRAMGERSRVQEHRIERLRRKRDHGATIPGGEEPPVDRPEREPIDIQSVKERAMAEIRRRLEEGRATG